MKDKYILKNIELLKEGLVGIEAVLEAGKAIRRAVGGYVEEKEGMSNVVNLADRNSGMAIRQKLAINFPGDAILSEDPPEKQPDIQNPLLLPRLWIADELDGSKNFSNKIDNVWVSLAFVKTGAVIVGVVFNPILDRMYYSQAGQGAYYIGCEYGGNNWIQRKITVSDTANLTNATIETSISYDKNETITHDLIKLALHLNGVSFRAREIGSSVEQICRVACGASDLQFHSGLKPWDYAAASLIVREAGGVIKRMDGSEFNVMDPDGVAGNEKLVDLFIGEIGKISGNFELIAKIAERVQGFKI